MKNVLIFAMLIACPLFYLWEHAYSFQQQQDIARLQELRQRMKEVCDSLAASVENQHSRYTIEEKALALGLRPKFERKPLLVALATASTATVQSRSERGTQDARRTTPKSSGLASSVKRRASSLSAHASTGKKAPEASGGKTPNLANKM